MKFQGPPQSGSVANQTFSRNRYGQYVRNRVQPDETGSTRRDQARADFATISAAWSATLTDAQRQSWNEFARRSTRDSLGKLYGLSGQALFVQAGMASYRRNGAVIVTDPPLTIEWKMQILDVDWAAGAWNVTWSNDCQVAIDVTSTPGSAGSFFLPPRGTWWVSWTNLSAGDGSPIGIRSGYPAVPSGQVVGIRFRQWSGEAVSGGCGFLGPAVYARIVAP